MSALLEAKVETNQLGFILSSNGVASTTFSLLSLRTQRHFTFKVKKAPARPDQSSDTWFVKYLFGQDNTSDYKYMGTVRNGVFTVATTMNDRESGRRVPTGLTLETPVVKALAWTVQRLNAGLDTPNMEIWHAGKCGRCGRKLTVPESVQSGFGPECITKIGMAA